MIEGLNWQLVTLVLGVLGFLTVIVCLNFAGKRPVSKFEFTMEFRIPKVLKLGIYGSNPDETTRLEPSANDKKETREYETLTDVNSNTYEEPNHTNADDAAKR